MEMVSGSKLKAIQKRLGLSKDYYLKLLRVIDRVSLNFKITG